MLFEPGFPAVGGEGVDEGSESPFFDHAELAGLERARQSKVLGGLRVRRRRVPQPDGCENLDRRLDLPLSQGTCRLGCPGQGAPGAGRWPPGWGRAPDEW